MMRKLLIALPALLLLAGCASYGGAGLQPGSASADDVVHVMGQPAMRWTDPDGTQRLAYPRGPLGYATFMASIGANGKLQGIENVLDEAHFAELQPGKTNRDQVLRMFGPPREKLQFPWRDEETWEYRYRDVYTLPARFIVLFDRTTGLVRSSMQISDTLGGDRNCR
jgi:hypothetical protein